MAKLERERENKVSIVGLPSCLLPAVLELNEEDDRKLQQLPIRALSFWLWNMLVSIPQLLKPVT